MANGETKTSGGFSFVDTLLQAIPFAAAAAPLAFGPKYIPGANLAINAAYAANQARQGIAARKRAADEVERARFEKEARDEAFANLGITGPGLAAYQALGGPAGDQALGVLAAENLDFSGLPFTAKAEPSVFPVISPQPASTQFVQPTPEPRRPIRTAPPTQDRLPSLIEQPSLAPEQVFSQRPIDPEFPDAVPPQQFPRLVQPTPEPRRPIRTAPPTQDRLPFTEEQFAALPLPERRRILAKHKAGIVIATEVEKQRQLMPMKVQEKAEGEAAILTQAIFADPSVPAGALAGALASADAATTPGYGENIQELVPLIDQVFAQDRQVRDAIGIFGRDVGAVASSKRQLDRDAMAFLGRAEQRIPFGFDTSIEFGVQGSISVDQIQEFIDAAHTLPARSASQAMFSAFMVNPRLAVATANYAATLDPAQDFETIAPIMSALSSYAENVSTGTAVARLEQSISGAGSDQERTFILAVAEQKVRNSGAPDASLRADQIKLLAKQVLEIERAKSPKSIIHLGGPGETAISTPAQRKGMQLVAAAKSLHDGIDLLASGLAKGGIATLAGPQKVFRELFAFGADLMSISVNDALSPIAEESAEDYLQRAYNLASDPALGETNTARALMTFAVARTIDPVGQISEAAREQAIQMIARGSFWENPVKTIASLKTFRRFADKRMLLGQAQARGTKTSLIPEAMREQAIVDVRASGGIVNRKQLQILLNTLARDPEFNVDNFVPDMAEIDALMEELQ